jgi:hypothetical protein
MADDVKINDLASVRAICDNNKFHIESIVEIMKAVRIILNVGWFFRKSFHARLCPFLNVHLHSTERTMGRACYFCKLEDPSLPSSRRLD